VGTTIGETGGSRPRRGAYLWCYSTASFSRSRRSIGASSIWTQQALPAVGKDQSRRKIIDSTFQMTEHLVSTSTELARNIFDLTEKARTEADEDSDAAK
jgi:hypothetical protein